MRRILIKSFGCDQKTWDEAKEKAKPISLSKVMRALLTMWIKNEIDIDWNREVLKEDE